MLISEFIERTGFTPTEECYHQFIEPDYNRSNLNKDEWCKLWKRSNGVEKTYQWQIGFDQAQLEIEKKNTIHHANKCIDLEKKYNELSESNKDLVYFLIEQSEKYSSSELREKAIKLIGGKEYIEYKLLNGKNIWEADRALLLDILNTI